MKLAVPVHTSFFTGTKERIALLFAIIGPGIITGTADNDAGGITTYATAGASFGYGLFWVVLVNILLLAVTQELGARLGLATGKGLAALLREHFPLRLTMGLIGGIFLVNITNILANFAGVTSVAAAYGVPHWLAVLSAAALIWFTVRHGSFRIVQRVFLASSAIFLLYIIAGYLAAPSLAGAALAAFQPSGFTQPGYLFTAVAIIGTTITAWGQFFVQSYFVDKGVQAAHLRYARIDVFVGSLWTNITAFFIALATASVLYPAGIHIADATQAALALEPFLGTFARHLFAWGFLNASLLGLAVIALTSAYMVTEAFGFEGRVDFKKESPAFFAVFGISIGVAALLVLIPHLPLVPVILASQAANTFLLPLLFFLILRLAQNSALMGPHTLSRPYSLFLHLLIALLTLLLIAMCVL